ncbi:olfactory receptor 4A16-like [Microtus ochrogaster]|uniref:Olfactory receptor n=1 Tax=Microtus ochrogaster TaxID=79684 RepID=A0ABM1UND2_MICOH|nr:olfactory receptor 4A16-like [Microtus ochrogaster]
MGESNNITEFVLLGLTQDPVGRKALFVMFLFIYIVTMVGNLLIVVTVITSPSLGSPMYFFLASLSFLDGLFSTAISPKLIIDLLYDQKTISFTACMSQLFIEHLFGGVDIVILVAMAYDRYVAICKPLHYLTIMNRRVCITLLMFAWIGGFTHSLIQIVFVYNLPFCGPNVIDHFICDMSPLLVLACTDTYFIGLTVIANGGIAAFIPPIRAPLCKSCVQAQIHLISHRSWRDCSHPKGKQKHFNQAFQRNQQFLSERGVYGRKVKAESSKAWFDGHDVIGPADLNYEGKNMKSKDGKEKVKRNKILVN